MQVNYVLSSKFGDDEAEFLFAPYSAFTVESVNFKCVRVCVRRACVYCCECIRVRA